MRRRYTTNTRIERLRATLSPRDQDILQTLAQVRLATAGQLARLHSRDVSSRQSRAVMASLSEKGLVTRLPRVIGGVRAGSAAHVYGLDIAGQRMVQPDHLRPSRPWSPGLPFLAHTLAITELLVRLTEAEIEGRLRLIEFVTEPAAWRSFAGPGGGRLTIKPDALVTVGIGGFEDRWFVEVDRGTEATTTLGRKCDLYRRYWASGLEHDRHGVFPRVLWLVPDEKRQGQLVTVLGRQPEVALPLFAVAMFDQAVARIGEGATA